MAGCGDKIRLGSLAISAVVFPPGTHVLSSDTILRGSTVLTLRSSRVRGGNPTEIKGLN